jgi:predicted MFS family arabinose efflux permease
MATCVEDRCGPVAASPVPEGAPRLPAIEATAGMPGVAAGTEATPHGSRRRWLAIVSLALGATVIVMSEFIPVGFLPDVASDLDVSLGLAGAMVLAPGLGAAVSAPVVLVAAGRLDRRRVIILLTSLLVLSNGLAALAPDFPVVLVARLLLGYGVAGIGGTLAGTALVARSRIWTFVAASVAFGVILTALPLAAAAPVAVSVLCAGWGLIWGVVPLMDSAGLTVLFLVSGTVAVAAGLLAAAIRHSV